MNAELLINPAGAALVLGGTMLATLARTGWHECGLTLHQLRALARPRFNAARMKAQLAGQVTRMRRDGLIRAEAEPLPDREFADATAALVRHRSTAALRDEHDRHRQRRCADRQRACRSLSQAGELAPVLGLAGTLLSLSQLPAGGLDEVSGLMQSVSLAVVSTLYGLLLAHLVCFPLARAIERHGEREEDEREELVRWLAGQLESACPSSALHQRMERAA
ncbi:MAG: MotA/TolQ/ExbB proton channel family protein [Novosphingobium sp.]